ncbi:MAG: formimidoylglutamate deiminase [Sphingomonas hengshuiensis]|uniref:Formimidoylglutamate deiminase n=1 Tax=Sphingomonas hengshuiensis TaxID=1609977 RepID=A0A2W5B8T7_9SPHN|nr:MAG: formimidoylglutamate deiminase [Sphingomonas hengshuiensis]
MRGMWCRQALLPCGWARDVRISLAGGRIAAIDPGVPPLPDDDRCATLLPGMPNLHSHAFQRLMAGLAETRTGPAGDDFWGWRTLMYRLVGSITPDDLAAIAAMAFCEMVESGFTRVGEFQYLHHQPDGRPYADPAAMAAALAQAAEATGIALTLLPVFYAHAGFGGTPPQDGQRRFVTGLDEFATLLDASRRAVATLGDAVVGVAPHSLRAVTPEELALLATMAPDAPLHLHIAEQRREVADCIAWSGQRPVDWLLSHHAVDARWCLVHATHVTAQECSALAASGATVGLCPVTEANLGDGIFPAAAFVGAGGRFGIGSDSNVRIDLAEELRLLEYGQRLTLERRAVLVAGGWSNGRTMFNAARAGGHAALGGGPQIAVGERADLVALRPAPRDAGDRALDGWIFARGSVERVWRAGREVVRDGRHTARDAIEAGFADVLRRRLP